MTTGTVRVTVMRRSKLRQLRRFVIVCVLGGEVNHDTVDRETFAIKKFSPVALVAKIKRAKKSFALHLQRK